MKYRHIILGIYFLVFWFFLGMTAQDLAPEKAPWKLALVWGILVSVFGAYCMGARGKK